MFSDVATLLSKIVVPNDMGYDVVTDIEYEVFVNKKSCTRLEFYQSHSFGVNAKFVLELRTEDFEQTREVINNKEVYATELIYRDCKYKIARAYDKQTGFTELTCE